jgi:hypothetical protein
MRVWGERVARRWDVVAAVALVAWLGYDLTARTVFGSVPWPESVVDYHILYDASRHVVATHEYPADKPYPYPPPAVALHAASAAFPFGVSAALWLALTGLAAVAAYATLARVLGLHRRPGMLLALPLAHALAAYFFQWDMRSINCNLIVLAAVLFGCAALAAGRDRAAGFWFATGVALKLMPVLLLPYLAWTGRWRAFAWGAFFSLTFWVAVPLAAFGPGGLAKVYGGWLGELARATDPAAKESHPILISLGKAASHATGGATAARAVVFGVGALWVCVGLAGAAASRLNRSRDGFAILTHASLLVLGPVAVNPYLEPYHLVPLAVPAVLLLAAAADSRRPGWARLAAAVAFAVALVTLKASSPWPLRGLLVNAVALVLCSAAVLVSWCRAAETRVSVSQWRWLRSRVRLAVRAVRAEAAVK